MKNKCGFTLVELSIVLVIIGLLIGGILVGQSLIDSARVSSEAQKISQWSIAIGNFQRKFKQYPGDSSYFSPQGNNGGNNTDSGGSCPASAFFEPYSAWSHLTQAQMLSGEQYVWSSANYCASPQIWKGLTPLQDFKDYDGVNYFPAGIRANRSGYNYGGKRYEYSINNYYKFYDMLALEKKLDDGVPSRNSGSIYSDTGDGYECNISGAGAEVIDQNLSSVKDVICTGTFYFNGDAPITPN
jgi:prepilin-type N-terminal cleavage/methylation domain-containing protein